MDVLKLLTTEQFYGSAVVVIYLVPASLLANMYIFAPGISIAKKTHFLIAINGGGALINILLNFFMIPRWGIVGAGLSTLIGCLVVFSAHMIISQRLYLVPHRWRQIVLGVVLAAAMAWWIPQINIADEQRWIINGLTLIVFLAISLILNLIHIREIRYGLTIIKSWLGRD